MSLILRWFHDDGERCRAYFRYLDGAGGRELVIAGRDWEHAAPQPHAERLEDYSEETLVDLARSWRDRAIDPRHEFR
jgi:hypothetical protein